MIVSQIAEPERCYLLPTAPEGHRVRCSIVTTDVDEIEGSGLTGVFLRVNEYQFVLFTIEEVEDGIQSGFNIGEYDVYISSHWCGLDCEELIH
jgi:hypothetical protein|tara:strand:+ start:160 stop:438 length:279 start_codon:yes stop_codon:yes gene_type:complete